MTDYNSPQWGGEGQQSWDDLEILLAKYNDLYQFAPVGYLVLDRQGRILNVNHKGSELLNGSQAKLQLQPFSDFIGQQQQTDFAAFLARVFSHATTLTCTLSIPHPEKSPLSIQVDAVADAAKQTCRLTLTDLGGYLQTERATIKKEKREALGALARGVAHDFNSLLTTILGNISLASIQSDEPEKLRRRLEDAETAIMRAKDLTRRLLNFAGGGSALTSVIDIHQLIKDTVQSTLHGPAISCEFQSDDPLWPLEADENQLRQMIQQLILNAAQSMPNGGTVRIEARNLEQPPADTRSVEIRVTDQGTGIPHQHLEKIFDPYFTTKPQASGLGLSNCYAIVSHHGGCISVESTPGQGSSFQVILPTVPPGAPPAPTPDGHLYRGSGRILLMDDEEFVRNIAQTILEELGYQVETAVDGRQAVDLYARRQAEGTPFAAVILDLAVPGGMGGMEAMRSLKELDPEAKGIVSSGCLVEPIIADYRQHGFQAELNKPYRIQEMSRVLRDLLTTAPPLATDSTRTGISD